MSAAVETLMVRNDTAAARSQRPWPGELVSNTIRVAMPASVSVDEPRCRRIWSILASSEFGPER